MLRKILSLAGRRTAAVAALLSLAGTGVTGCGILDVEDPTTIQESSVANAQGAELLRLYALNRMGSALGIGAYWDGLFADEFSFELSVYTVLGSSPDEAMDRRQSVDAENRGGGSYSLVPTMRRAATDAFDMVSKYSSKAHAGEMLAARGVGTLMLAENFCPGFPLNEVVDGRVVFGSPTTTVQAFENALADFDSAIVLAADSARILNFARLGRARALLGLGRVDEAGATVSAIPTTYQYLADINGSNLLSKSYYIWQAENGPTVTVSSNEGGNGLDFSTANDPRVPVVLIETSDDGRPLYALDMYPTTRSSMVIASGLDARMIQAEAALAAHDNAAWLQFLVQARTEGLPAAIFPDTLSDPGDDDARLDLTMRERAFWLFGTNRRLGDLRRLVSVYHRDPEDVFPTGPYRLGGTYGTGTSTPFPAAAEAAYNPAITGCLSR